MLKVTTVYKVNNTELSRVVENNSSFPLIIGEMLYGIKVQNNDFNVDSVFKSLSIPESINRGITITDNDEWKITITRVNKK